MIGALARKFFGSANDRRIKGYQSRVDAINALEPEVAALSDEALKARTAEFRQATRRRQDARRHSGSGLRHRARGGQAHARPAAFRRAADRRHGAARRRYRRDEDRRRQDAGRDACGLSQRAGRQGRPRRHRQRLSRPARLRMDGTDLRLPRHDHRRHRPRPRRCRAQGSLCARHHLRHQQRIRLRLSARQHEVPARGHGPARPLLRHRRRSRLDPDRRGAHAADHLRPARRPFGILQHHRHLLPQARQDRLRRRREAAHGDADRSRHGKDRNAAARRRPAQGRFALRRRERLGRSPHQPGAARALRCSRATRTTSSATTRSSSSTSSPAA